MINMENMIYPNGDLLIFDKPDYRIIDTVTKKVRTLNRVSYAILIGVDSGTTPHSLVTKLGIEGDEEKTTKLMTFLQDLEKALILTKTKEKGGKLFKKNIKTNPILEKLFIEVTTQCNFYCKHCYSSCSRTYSHESSDEIAFNEIENLICQADEVGVYKVDITGGELFLRNDAIAIMDLLSKHAMLMNIFTNGYLLDNNLIKYLSSNNFIRSVFISLDDIDPLTHDNFRGKQGAWEKTIESILNLKNAGTNVIINTTIRPENIKNISKMHSFFNDELNVDYRMAPILPAGRGEKLESIDLDLFTQELICIGKVPSNLNNISRKDTGQYIPNCGIGNTMLFVTSSGQLTLCPTMSPRENSSFLLGDIYKDSLREVWETHPLLKEFRKNKCVGGQCQYINLCRGGCRSRAYIESGRFDTIDPVVCHLFYGLEDNTVDAYQ